MKVRFFAISAVIAALYVAITIVIAPLSFGAVQFRFSEIFNQLVAFNPRFIVGIVLGVFISNATLSTLGPIDVVFGVCHSLITLGIFIFICKFVKNLWARMIVNSFLFAATMSIIAWELNIVLELPFFETWLFTAIGEFAVMMIGAPIMMYLNKRLNFKNLI